MQGPPSRKAPNLLEEPSELTGRKKGVHHELEIKAQQTDFPGLLLQADDLGKDLGLQLGHAGSCLVTLGDRPSSVCLLGLGTSDLHTSQAASPCEAPLVQISVTPTGARRGRSTGKWACGGWHGAQQVPRPQGRLSRPGCWLPGSALLKTEAYWPTFQGKDGPRWLQ